MYRFLPAAFLLGWLAGPASAQCLYPVRWYPWGPSIWGAPAPLTIPAAVPPFVPKAGVGLKEEETPKPTEADPKEKELPKIPKVKLPLPDPPIPELPKPKEDGPKSDVPKTDAGRKEPAADLGKPEQFFVPAERKRAEAPAEVRVGFFNHSDREINLEVNGEAVKLPSAQYVTLRLPRTFSWSEKGQKATDVVVPPDADGIEMVFRK